MGIEILMMILFSTLFFGAIMAGFFGYQSISEERLCEMAEASVPQKSASDHAFFFDEPATMENGGDRSHGLPTTPIVQHADAAEIREQIVRDLQELISRELSLSAPYLFEPQALHTHDTIQ